MNCFNEVKLSLLTQDQGTGNCIKEIFLTRITLEKRIVFVLHAIQTLYSRCSYYEKI